MIDWKPFSPKALDFIQNSTARLNIAYGAVRSGKTVSCLVRWLEYILNGPPGDLAMLGRTTTTLQRNMLNDLQDIVGTRYFKWVNRQAGEIKVFNRRIWLCGANNEDAEIKLRGATFAGALCDELTTYPQSVFMQLIARCSVPGACIFANTNPDNPHHWVNTDFILNEQILDKKLWHFTMEDNLSLDSEYIANLKRTYTGVWFARMVEGLWVVAEGLVYPMFNESEHTVEHTQIQAAVKADAFDRYVVSNDYGTVHPCVFLLAGHHAAEDKWYILDEYYFKPDGSRFSQKTDEEQLHALMQLVYDNLPQGERDYKPIRVLLDQAPIASSFNILYRRKRPWAYIECDNTLLEGIEHTASALNNDQIKVSKKCTNLIREFGVYSWDKDANEDKPIRIDDDAVSALRYFVQTERVATPRPGGFRGGTKHKNVSRHAAVSRG